MQLLPDRMCSAFPMGFVGASFWCSSPCRTCPLTCLPLRPPALGPAFFNLGTHTTSWVPWTRLCKPWPSLPPSISATPPPERRGRRGLLRVPERWHRRTGADPRFRPRPGPCAGARGPGRWWPSGKGERARVVAAGPSLVSRTLTIMFQVPGGVCLKLAWGAPCRWLPGGPPVWSGARTGSYHV